MGAKVCDVDRLMELEELDNNELSAELMDPSLTNAATAFSLEKPMPIILHQLRNVTHHAKMR